MATAKSSNDELKANKLFDVSAVTAIVTGGGTGIGLMITQALVANGAKVYITGRREEALEKVVKQYNTGPGEIIAFPGDFSIKDEIMQRAQELSSKEPNGIQLLVNNAGIARDDSTKFSAAGKPEFSSAEDISKHFLAVEESSWADTFKTNVTGHFYTAMAFLPLLQKGNSRTKGYTSSVINIDSISGLMKGSSSGQFAYACSKAASLHLTRMLATTFVEAKVRVNSIAPGVFPSEMTTGDSSDDQKSTIESKMGNPAGRAGHDSDMAASVLFLAGPGGVFYNEQIICPDGGSTLVQPAVK